MHNSVLRALVCTTLLLATFIFSLIVIELWLGANSREGRTPQEVKGAKLNLSFQFFHSHLGSDTKWVRALMNFKNKAGDMGGDLKGCVPNMSDLVFFFFD